MFKSDSVQSSVLTFMSLMPTWMSKKLTAGTSGTHCDVKPPSINSTGILYIRDDSIIHEGHTVDIKVNKPCSLFNFPGSQSSDVSL